MEFAVETWGETPIVYVRRTGPYGPENKQTMERLKEWAKKRGLLEGNAVLFGIPQDDPRTTAPEACRYDACIATDLVLEQDETDPLQSGIFEGGTYAVFRIAHTAEGVRQAWNEILPALQAGGCEIANKPTVERYAEKLLREDWCELCVPIRI
ncbi:DNA gyrase inhibitor [Saccharibacillus sp. O23]|uniref:AraC family transcriptional regulator n=1 Tax=Saccharibacillus sp. O23 TaxID=2009338 RepID=UPI000B4E295C|nr:GyrI-like domain-containing protein [Saccharibacillus sp. O23]OWR33019.1 DNA gyrase inhibitor [Saccharibacillus sp. O23]